MIYKGESQLKKVVSVFLACCLILCLYGCEKNILKRQNMTGDSGDDVEEDFLDADLPVRFAVELSDGFNPLTAESYSLRRVMERVYEPLFAVDDNFKPFGVLAESARPSSDGMSITVRLKSNIVWHDNTSFSASDVVYTVNKISAGETVINVPKLSGASAVDSLTAVIRLKEPVMNPVALLTFPIVKNNTPLKTQNFNAPVGTGKYRYAGKISVNEYSFVPFEAYHGEKAASSFEVAAVRNYDEQVQMFRAGEADAYFAGTDETVSAANGNTKTKDEPSGIMVYIGINFNNPIFWGENTRRAVSCAINKNAIINGIIFKRGRAAEYPINPECWLAQGLDNSPSYSVDEAEELMAADGWELGNRGYYTRITNGKEQECIIRILTSEDETFLKISDYIARELTSFGINCSVQSVKFDEYAAMIDAGYYDLFIGEKTLGSNMDFSDLIKKPNVFTYVSEPLEDTAKAAACTNDEQQLKQLYETCALTIKNDTPFIPLYFKVSTVFYSELFG